MIKSQPREAKYYVPELRHLISGRAVFQFRYAWCQSTILYTMSHLLFSMHFQKDFVTYAWVPTLPLCLCIFCLSENFKFWNTHSITEVHSMDLSSKTLVGALILLSLPSDDMDTNKINAMDTINLTF